MTVICLFLFDISVVIRAPFFSDEGFPMTGVLVHVKSAEIISNNILFPFYVLEVRRALFYVQSPSHDSVRVERFVRQVFMISVYTDLLTEEDVSKFLQNFDYG